MKNNGGLKIQEIKEKNIWESFLLGCKEKTFLQSWNWGEFNKMMENKIWRLGIYNNQELLSIVLVIKIEAKRGRFLLIQHGPIFNFQFSWTRNRLPEGLLFNQFSIFKNLFEELKKIAKNENCDFIRIASLWEKNKDNKKKFSDLNFRESPMHANAYEATWKLDITLTEDELLINMRKTTRYLIRQAMKNLDITIEKSGNLEDVEIYQKLNIKVSQRQNFSPFSFEYIKNEFEVFSKDNEAVLFLGKHNGELASAALIIFWSGIGFYHQAVSDSKYAKFSIPYLLQWEAIKEAKKRGCILYDFWGYVEPKSNHPWAGPTLFKMGFGGQVHNYVKTQDFPLSWKYWPTWLFEKIRKIKRGL
jgi:lipid II:glycine glycyltransferase (peptidoglycan interpeptide bridge formation enzyme)